MLVAMPFDGEDEAVRLANATQYGLAAYVWTSDLTRAHRVAHAIETGMCWINSHNVRDLRTPFGGVKRSGIGLEGGDYAFDFYCDTEIVHVALGVRAHPATRARRRRRGSSVSRAAELVARGPARSAVRRHARGVRRAPRLRPRRVGAVLRGPARARRRRAHRRRPLPSRLGGAAASLARPAPQRRDRRRAALVPGSLRRRSRPDRRRLRPARLHHALGRRATTPAWGGRCASGTRSASRSSSSTTSSSSRPSCSGSTSTAARR